MGYPTPCLFIGGYSALIPAFRIVTGRMLAVIPTE